MEAKYVSKQVALTKGVYEILDAYRDKVAQQVGFKVSLAQAIVHAVTAAERDSSGESESVVEYGDGTHTAKTSSM